MKTFIIGGNFGVRKASGIVEKIAKYFDNPTVINGGCIEDLPTNLLSDLILWLPNIQNEVPKHYPKKNAGNVLICSKVMRDGYSIVDAVSRIFKMNGNAVIAVYKTNSFVTFKLIDALGNIWFDGSDIEQLCSVIKDFYKFTKSSIRMNSVKITEEIIPEKNHDLDKFIELNKSLANYIQTSCGQRFFGNLSTRCSKLFPSYKVDDVYVFISPRNINKYMITSDDMICITLKDNLVRYIGDIKPSVDSPIQLLIYKKFPRINYMIHGHAFVKNAVETENYCLCGDIREVEEVSKLIDSDCGAINLKNHGFILYSDSLSKLIKLTNTLEFSYERNIKPPSNFKSFIIY